MHLTSTPERPQKDNEPEEERKDVHQELFESLFSDDEDEPAPADEE